MQNIAINEDDELVDVIKKMKYNINLLHVKSEELTSKNLSLKTEIDKLKMNLPQVCFFIVTNTSYEIPNVSL